MSPDGDGDEAESAEADPSSSDLTASASLLFRRVIRLLVEQARRVVGHGRAGRRDFARVETLRARGRDGRASLRRERRLPLLRAEVIGDDGRRSVTGLKRVARGRRVTFEEERVEHSEEAADGQTDGCERDELA